MSQHKLAAGNRFVLLTAPSHDDLTEYITTLLENLPPLGYPTVLYKFDGPTTYDQVPQRLTQPPSLDVLVIFGGHGDKASLQGPGVFPGAPRYRELRSTFFDKSHLPLAPTFMLAFCCSAGQGLGDLYDRFTERCTFVGFDDLLYLVMEGGNYADCWQTLLRDIASGMLTATDDRSLERSIEAAYDNALSSFPRSADNKNEWGLMMRAYLRKQAQTISFVRT